MFAKTHRDPPPNFFSTEATGLRWLTVSGTVRTPNVIAATDGDGERGGRPALLVLEWIRFVHRAPTRPVFGRALARLHRDGADQLGFDRFGRPDGRPTGSRALPNDQHESWPTFFAECRLRPLRRLAQQSLPPGDLARLGTVIDHLDELAGPSEPPALLHGDLWAGNRLVDEAGDSWIIDPATFVGHREFDLAMMRLFGGFSDAEFDAYHDEYPLAPGWEQRVPLWQLAPLVVHAIKFGGPYPAAVAHALDQTLGNQTSG